MHSPTMTGNCTNRRHYTPCAFTVACSSARRGRFAQGDWGSSTLEIPPRCHPCTELLQSFSRVKTTMQEKEQNLPFRGVRTVQWSAGRSGRAEVRCGRAPRPPPPSCASPDRTRAPALRATTLKMVYHFLIYALFLLIWYRFPSSCVNLPDNSALRDAHRQPPCALAASNGTPLKRVQCPAKKKVDVDRACVMQRRSP